MILDTYNTPNKISQSLIDSVVAHADIHLDLSDLEELQIHFKAANGDNCGYFDGIGDEEDGVAAIEINSKKPIDEIVKTIFHELVHVQQVLHNKFCDIEKTWFGESYEGVCQRKRTFYWLEMQINMYITLKTLYTVSNKRKTL
jgi:hypothetical protein